MPSSTSLLGVVAAALVVLLLPGPAVLSSWVGVLNPKIAVFLLGFLPQFVEPSRRPVPAQVLFLGLIYVTLARFINSAYALLAGSLRHLLGGPLMEEVLPRYASGVLHLGLGLTTALTGRQH